MFAHLPLILKPEGTGKLSKRDGDRLGFPVFPIEWKDPFTGETSSGYREAGYFPEAMVNMLALLGWNPGTEQEIFSMDELIREFSLDRVGKSGSRFDPAKARWFNHHYLVNRPTDELTQIFCKMLSEKDIQCDPAYVSRVVELVKDRSDFVKDFWEQSYFFFETPSAWDLDTVRKKWKEDTPGLVRDFRNILSEMIDFSAENIKAEAETYTRQRDKGLGHLMSPLRLCLVGGTFGPDLMVICEMLGREEVMVRIDKALSYITENTK